MTARVLALAAAAAVALPAGAAAHGPAGARGGDPVTRAATLAETIAARTRFFGAEHVDPATGALPRDRVILSWFGVSNFAAAIRGHVVLLDAWVPRGAFEGYVPTSPAELAQLAPELIFLGHAHFDHAADAVPIAQASGATIVGLAEHCSEMVARAGAMPPRCVSVLPAGAPPGTAADVDLLRGVEVRAVKHVHSGVTRPDGEDGYHVPVLPALTPTVIEHPASPQTMAETVQHVPDAEGGSVLYRFRFAGRSFLWHDTSGPLKDRAPGVFDVLRSLRPIDVQIGAIQGFNQFTNGMRDPRLYIEALRPKIFVPEHHDDWAPGVTARSDAYRQPFYDELARIPAERRPEVRFLDDPGDYVRPALVFGVELERPRLVRRCTGGGVLRAGLAGDLADVTAATLRLPGGRTRTLRAETFSVRVPRRELEGRRRGAMTAVVTESGGARTVLRRSVPSCGVRRR